MNHYDMSQFERYVRLQSELGNEKLQSQLGNTNTDITRLDRAMEHGKILFKSYMDAKEEATIAKEEATIDSLTGLPNYRGLTQILEREVSESKRNQETLIIGMVDFVKLKEYNDTYGHIQGNEAIRKIAIELKKYTRICDIVATITEKDIASKYAEEGTDKTINVSEYETNGMTATRYGGDEFCLVFSVKNAKNAGKVMRRLVKAFNNLTIDTVVGDLPDEGYKNVPISMGFTQLRPDETYQQAIHRADKAMYEAKRVQKKSNSKRTRFRSA